MEVTLKNVKLNVALSDETDCFSATIYIDGKRAATCGNRGNGGPNFYDFKDHTLRKSFEDYCKSLPYEGPYDLKMDAELYISELLMKWEENHQIKKWCKKKTIFRLKGDKKDQWRTYATPYHPDFGKKIRAKHGDQLEEIGNERF
jgi:hypothetical protein